MVMAVHQGESLPQLDMPYGKYVWASRGVVDNPHFRTWLERLFLQLKTGTDLASLEQWKQWKQQGLLFWDLLFSIWLSYIIFIISSIACREANCCCSQVRNAFIGFCSAAVSDTCAVAQCCCWWRNTRKLVGFTTFLRVFDRTHDPKQKIRRCIVASELVYPFFSKDGMLQQCDQTPHTHTHTHICRGYCLAQALGELIEVDLQPYFNQFPDRNEFLVPEWCVILDDIGIY